MKALMLIDVDKDEIGEATATITSNGITFFAEGIIKPMPTKKDLDTDERVYLQRGHDKIYKEGWNDCIDEILGETE